MLRKPQRVKVKEVKVIWARNVDLDLSFSVRSCLKMDLQQEIIQPSVRQLHIQLHRLHNLDLNKLKFYICLMRFTISLIPQ